MFESRWWKLDLGNLWWNVNRIYVRDSIIKHFNKGGHRVLLNGCKGCGKTTISKYLEPKLKDVLIVDEAQQESEEDRQATFWYNDKVLMVSVDDGLVDDGYELIVKVEPITQEEVGSYINHQKALHIFEADSILEIYKASRGSIRMINTICRAAIEEYTSEITAKQIEHIAKRKFKLRY